jgi:hypothetical protein
VLDDNDTQYLKDITSKLLVGFNDWIVINSNEEKSLILDNAYEFKIEIINNPKNSLQKKYFLDPDSLNIQEKIFLLNKWRVIFTDLVNSNLDRISKDSFKIWFLSLASEIFEELNEAGRLMWKTLILGIDHCKKFSLNDIPSYHNKFSSN